MVRTLPGVTFQTVPPPLPERLPRMDIAAFVGLAAAGPIHIPVPVEDVTRFRDIFGGDLPIAWDDELGEERFAYLGPAVEAFFANGGRRCWVVRVARGAETNRFGLPGLLAVGGDDPLEWRPAQVQARCAGSWSDALRVGTVERSRAYQATAFDSEGDGRYSVELVTGPDTARAADLLRLTFGADGPLLFLTVESAGQLNGRQTVTGSGRWFLRRRPASPPAAVLEAVVLAAAGAHTGAPLPVAELSLEGAKTVLILDGTLADAPAPGDLLRLRLDDGTIVFLPVDEVRAEPEEGSPPLEMVRLSGREALWTASEGDWSAWRAGQEMASPPGETLPLAERMAFDIWVWREQAAIARQEDLAFSRAHDRFWGGLPADDELFELPVGKPPRKLTALEEEAAEPRFPLAGPAGPAYLYLPVGMGRSGHIDRTAGVLAEHEPGTAPPRDGIAAFTADLFLDENLKGLGSRALLAEAEYRRYIRGQRLEGLHSILPLEEVTLIAAPDAIHRAWHSQIIVRQPPLAAPALDVPTENADGEGIRLSWTAGDERADQYILEEALDPAFTQPHLAYQGPATAESLPLPQDCPRLTYFRVRATFGDESSPWSNTQAIWLPEPEFEECEPRLLPAPELLPILESSPPDGFWLDWHVLPVSGEVESELQEAGDPLFADPRSITVDGETAWRIDIPAGEARFYRVRLVSGGEVSPWSNTVFYPTAPAEEIVWKLDPPGAYSDEVLRRVHGALLRFCAARADLFALLALPAHFRRAEALDYSRVLGEEIQGEETALSYGALYHPWLFQRAGRGRLALQYAPPDGAVCGTYAAQAINRGAWIAPANLPLQDVLALAPEIDREGWADLFNAQVNVVQRDPRGYLLLSAETLSAEADLRPVNVRRLIILLRRLALREGMKYVFQVNNSAFRRLVRHKFETILAGLYQMGAFAGNSPEGAFQVIVEATRQDLDAGRLVVELRVAPSRPLAFITVRLVQVGHDGLAVESI